MLNRVKYNSALLSMAATALAALMPVQAHAAATTSLGGMIASLGNDIWKPVVLLLWSGSMLVGTFLVASGLFKAIQSVGREEAPLKEVILRLLGGGALVAFWDALKMGPGTMFGTLMTFVGWGTPNAAAGGVTDCLNGTSGGLTCMAKNFSSNVVPAFMSVAWSLAFVWGAWLILTAVHAAATQEGKGGREIKVWPRIAVGAILVQLPLFIGSIGNTLGYTRGVIGSSGMVPSDDSMLAYVAPANWGLLQTYSELIGYVFIITAMFGVIAVWRGIAYIKAGAEGSQQGTTGAAMTHIIGGAMLVNAKASTCFIVTTFLGQGLSFCN